jgi:hypothetical protein
MVEPWADTGGWGAGGRHEGQGAGHSVEGGVQEGSVEGVEDGMQEGGVESFEGGVLDCSVESVEAERRRVILSALRLGYGLESVEARAQH